MAKLINLKPFAHFLKSGSAAAIIMIGCVFLSLLIANLPIGGLLERLLAEEIGFSTNAIHLKYSVAQWINDGLMAIFFLLVGLEIKRELVEGELSTFRKASLPIISAIGGAVLPAIIFFYFNQGTTTSKGWGIPMATDIAFALAIITFLGKLVPSSLKIFLSALAIADDLLAIIVIAFFYSSGLEFSYLIYAAGVFALLLIFNFAGVTRLVFYLVPGIFLWYFIHQSGIHATIAGVLTAFTLPTTVDDKESSLERLEHILFKPVNFIILPLFALVNTNIRIDLGMFKDILNPLSLGIILGLLIGKPVGISLTAFLSVKSGVSSLPENARWSHIIGAGILGGIGFTMSIFVALLSFNGNEGYLSSAKLFVLIASATAAVAGSVWLIAVSRKVE